MRIYKLTTHCNELGTGVTFHPSHSDAWKSGREYIKDTEPGCRSFDIEPVDFTLTKKGVLALLSEHAPYRDNG